MPEPAPARPRARPPGADSPPTDDVVQETFIGSLNVILNVDATRELQTYLFTIAAQKLTDHLRRMGRPPLRSICVSSSDLLQQQFDRHGAASSIARSQERRDLE